MSKYIATTRSNYLSVHTCSKCGKINVLQQSYSTTGQYRGEFGASKSDQKESVKAESHYDHQVLLSAMKRMASEHSYDDLQLTGSCEQCGHEEPWAKFRNKTFEVIQLITILIPVMIYLFLYMADSYGDEVSFAPFWYTAAFSAIINLVLFIIEEHRHKGLKQEIQALKPESHPSICFSKEEVISAIVKITSAQAKPPVH